MLIIIFVKEVLTTVKTITSITARTITEAIAKITTRITIRITIRITEVAKTKTATAISDNLIFIYYRKRVGIGAQADTHLRLFILVF